MNTKCLYTQWTLSVYTRSGHWVVSLIKWTLSVYYRCPLNGHLHHDHPVSIELLSLGGHWLWWPPNDNRQCSLGRNCVKWPLNSDLLSVHSMYILLMTTGCPLCMYTEWQLTTEWLFSVQKWLTVIAMKLYIIRSTKNDKKKKKQHRFDTCT